MRAYLDVAHEGRPEDLDDDEREEDDEAEADVAPVAEGEVGLAVSAARRVRGRRVLRAEDAAAPVREARAQQVGADQNNCGAGGGQSIRRGTVDWARKGGIAAHGQIRQC